MTFISYMLFFVRRSLCIHRPCSGDFAGHAENCQTIGLDESTRYLTNKRCTFIIILFFAFLTSQSSVHHTGNHISLQRELNSGQLCRQCLIIILRHTFFVSQCQSNYVGKSLHSDPKPGLQYRYHTDSFHSFIL